MGGAVARQRPGTSSYDASRTASAPAGGSSSEQRSSSFDPQSGTSSYDASRSASDAAGGSANLQRSSSFDAKTGEEDYDAIRSATGAEGSSITRETEGEQGSGFGHETSVYDARTGQTNTYGSGWSGGDHYASADGQVYRNTGSGWEKNTSSGWQSAASEDTSWADRDQQARSAGADRFSSFAGDGWDRLGGGQRWGGGGGFGRWGGAQQNNRASE